MLRKGTVLGFTTALAISLVRCADLPVESRNSAEDDLPVMQAVVQSNGLTCTRDGATLKSGALYKVCVNPATWKNDLVVFVPGYHDPASTPVLPNDVVEGSSVTEIVTNEGYALASTSFRGTGLVDPDTWINQDLLELVDVAKQFLFQQTRKRTRYVYQTGGSQGGLITTLAVERHPNVFSGGLAACGPIGSYRRQINYMGDFRVVFDYFFKGEIAGWPVWTPTPGTIDTTTWAEAAKQALTAIRDASHSARVNQLLRVTGAPIDQQVEDPQPSIEQTVLGLLWYSFRGTNDAMTKLGGMPFDNRSRTYSGSDNDGALNTGVQQFTFTANGRTLDKLETSGRLRRPLVTMHTTGDAIVPQWHQDLYRQKASSAWHTAYTYDRYGHCNFTSNEVLAAFSMLVFRVSGVQMIFSSSSFSDAQAQAEFLEVARRHGADPVIIPDGERERLR